MTKGQRMKTVEMTELTSLKDMVALAKEEAEVVLTEGHKPVAKILPFAGPPVKAPAAPQQRKLGLHPGAWVASDDFDKPLPDDFWLGKE
jgi:antitoxin (DNA-binding transcriptional repressor) of toxin-antitoxin stability system